MRGSWEFHKYVAVDAPPERQHMTAMYKIVSEKTGPEKYSKTPHTMWFVGPTAEDVESKIDAFWDVEEQKAANLAAGRVKAAKKRAAKKSPPVQEESE